MFIVKEAKCFIGNIFGQLTCPRFVINNTSYTFNWKYADSSKFSFFMLTFFSLLIHMKFVFNAWFVVNSFEGSIQRSYVT